MAHAVPVHNIPQFCLHDKDSIIMGVFCMKLVVMAFMREVKVSSGIDFFSPLGLEPAPHVSEVLAEQYQNVYRSILDFLSFILSTSYSMIVLSQVYRGSIVWPIQSYFLKT